MPKQKKPKKYQNTEPSSIVKKPKVKLTNEERNDRRRAAYDALSPDEKREINAKRRDNYKPLSPDQKQKKNDRQNAQYHALSPDEKREVNAKKNAKQNARKKKKKPIKNEINNPDKKRKKNARKKIKNQEENEINNQPMTIVDDDETVQSENKINSFSPIQPKHYCNPLSNGMMLFQQNQNTEMSFPSYEESLRDLFPELANYSK